MAEINKKVLNISSILSAIISSFIVVYCTVKRFDAPLIAEVYVICTAALLGLDEVIKKYFTYYTEKIKSENKEEEKKLDKNCEDNKEK